MSDRRAEAFAVLDEGMSRYPVLTVLSPPVVAALRSVLTRHHPIPGVGLCHRCDDISPCPDETAVIDALLGVAR